MTLLGKYLRSIRLKRNISELKAARRASLSLEKFVEYEYAPEKVSLNELTKIFAAIEMTEIEYAEFSTLCVRFKESIDISSVRKRNNKRKLSELELKIKSDKSQNVLMFQDKRGFKKQVKNKKRSEEIK